MFCYVLPCAAMCRCVKMCCYVRLCVACDYVFVYATLSYCELKSETMCYYALLCVTICNYVWRCVAMCVVLLCVICNM
jgi:hypothetical protein